MSYRDIQAGNHTAKLLAVRLIEAKTGTPGVEAAFKVGEETLNWTGWLTPDTIENTMKTMVDVLGYNGDDEVVPGTSQFKTTSFDTNKDVVLVVEIQTYEGKSSPRIKWVNNVGGGSAFKLLTPETVKAKLQQVGFKAAFHAARAASGAAAPKAALSSSEVPF